MEQHPVPQNVTTFQFRLIGDMTIKQFGYLAGGLIVGYIFYKLPLPFFFTWPLALFSGLLGFGFAFVPVEERPMDVWVLSFLKNVYSPTQYIWQKQKKTATPAPEDISATKTAASLMEIIGTRVSSRRKTKETPEAREAAEPAAAAAHAQATAQILTTKQPKGFFSDLFSFITFPRPTTTSVTPQHHAPVPTPHRATPHPVAAKHLNRGPTVLLTQWIVNPFGWLGELFKGASAKRAKTPVIPPTPVNILARTPNVSVTGRHLDLTPASATPTPQPISVISAEEQARKTMLEQQLQSLQEELVTKKATDSRLRELQEQVAAVLSQKTKMEEELLALRRQMMAKESVKIAPSRPASIAQATPSPTVRVVTADIAPHVGLPKLTTFPNVITGIIKDSTSNLLSGVLVTVRDKEDVPVRALKTNKLGQFAASTPLPNGQYVIEIEDPRNLFIFDRVQVTLTGGLIPAVEITAKNQKQVEREKLAQQIFGNQQV